MKSEGLILILFNGVGDHEKIKFPREKDKNKKCYRDFDL